MRAELRALAVTVDPVVVALAIALTSGQPIETLVATGSTSSAPSRNGVPPTSLGRSPNTAARTPRSKNRKG